VSNPFKPTRFEHAAHPLIWVSPKVRPLEEAKSAYVKGTRGSGKTTILKAVNWRERLFNPTLYHQIPVDKIHHISVYFRFPDYLSNSVHNIPWRRYYPDTADVSTLSFTYFALIVETIALQLLAEAISTLRAERQLSFAAEAEQKCVVDIYERHKSFFEIGSGPKGMSSLVNLAAALRLIHRQLNEAATRGRVKDLFDRLPHYEPGEFTSNCVPDLIKICKEGNIGSEPTPLICGDLHFKICIDDCEVLRSEQQLFLNSIVRKSSSPVFWLISYVGRQFEATSTVIPGQNLTDADRTVIDLDSDSDKDFRDLCEAVSNLRLKYTRSQNANAPEQNELPRFDLKRALGTTNINQLFMDATRSTLSSDLRDLLKQADSLRGVFGPNTYSDEGTSSNEPDTSPIYQTYVMRKLYPRRRPEEVIEQLRISQKAYFRRKQRAALLTMCSEYRIGNIPYAGDAVVIGMSDGCIRDYLEIMAEIYEIATRDSADRVRSFVSLRGLSWKLQRRAIQAASVAKFEGIRESAPVHWREVSKMIECLGRLTSLLQSDHRSIESLRTPERGIFVFDLSKIVGHTDDDRKSAHDALLEILLRCEGDGFLRRPVGRRLDRRAESASLISMVEYRLHRRFAANFRFSFRGAYEYVELPVEDILEICADPASINADEWALRVQSKISKVVLQQEELPYLGA
jgi:hypothetical protein